MRVIFIGVVATILHAEQQLTSTKPIVTAVPHLSAMGTRPCTVYYIKHPALWSLANGAPALGTDHNTRLLYILNPVLTRIPYHNFLHLARAR